MKVGELRDRALNRVRGLDKAKLSALMMSRRWGHGMKPLLRDNGPPGEPLIEGLEV